MSRRIIIDGIRVEGVEAKRIVNEVLRGVDESGAPRRRMPWGMLVGTAICAGVASAVTAVVLQRWAGDSHWSRGWHWAARGAVIGVLATAASVLGSVEPRAFVYFQF